MGRFRRTTNELKFQSELRNFCQPNDGQRLNGLSLSPSSTSYPTLLSLLLFSFSAWLATKFIERKLVYYIFSLSLGK